MNKKSKTYQAPACLIRQVGQAAFICTSTEGSLDPYTDVNIINEDFD